MPFHESNDDLLATQVGSCPQCDTLLTLPVAAEPFDTIRCPGCGGQFSLGAIKMRDLRLAEAVIATPNEPTIDLDPSKETFVASAESMEEPKAETAEDSSSSQGQESLEDWLKRTTGVSLTNPGEQAAETPMPIGQAPEEPAQQNQTVDWTPGSFSLETPEETNPTADTSFQVEEPETASEFEVVQESTNNIESLLQQAEQQLADSESELARVKSEEVSEQASFQLSEFEVTNNVSSTDEQDASEFHTREEERQEELQEVIEDQFDPSDIANRLQTVHEQEYSRNRWGGPVSALAGLLVLGGVTYVILSNQLGLDDGLVAGRSGGKTTVNLLEEPDDKGEEAPGFDESMEESGASIVPVSGTESEEEQSLDPASFNEHLSTNSLQPVDSVGDRYSTSTETLTEPNPFSPPANTIVTQPKNDVSQELPMHRLQGAPTYRVEELQQASNYSEALVKQIQEAALSQGEDRDQSLGKHYAELCYLAQVISLLDLNSTSADLRSSEMIAVDHYKRLFQNKAATAQVNQVAQHWIEWTERPYGGVFLTGVPDDMQYAGELITYRLPLGDSFVHIVTEKPIDVDRFVMSDSQTMGIIGIVVENPIDRIRGYEGDADRVIWCRKTIPIGDNQPWAR